MSALVILLLAALWAAILLPAALRARRQHRPLASADGFARSMTALGARQRPSHRPDPGDPGRPDRPDPGGPGGPGGAVRAVRRAARNVRIRPLPGPHASPAGRRRRSILVGLVAALASTAIIGLVAGGLAWALTVVSGSVLAAYLGLVAAFVWRRGDGRPRAFPAGSGVRASTTETAAARAAAARAAAVRTAVVRAPAGNGASAPAVNGGSAPAGNGASAPLVAGDRDSPRVTDGPRNAGLVAVRTVPRVRAGG